LGGWGWGLGPFPPRGPWAPVDRWWATSSGVSEAVNAAEIKKEDEDGEDEAPLGDFFGGGRGRKSPPSKFFSAWKIPPPRSPPTSTKTFLERLKKSFVIT